MLRAASAADGEIAPTTSMTSRRNCAFSGITLVVHTSIQASGPYTRRKRVASTPLTLPRTGAETGTEYATTSREPPSFASIDVMSAIGMSEYIRASGFMMVTSFAPLRLNAFSQIVSARTPALKTCRSTVPNFARNGNGAAGFASSSRW